MKKILVLFVYFVSISSIERQYINRYRPGNLYRDLQSEGYRNPYTVYSPFQGLFLFNTLYNMEKDLFHRLRNDSLQEAHERSRDAFIAERDHFKQVTPYLDLKELKLVQDKSVADSARRTVEDLSGRNIFRNLLYSADKSGINEDTLPETHKDAKRIQNFSRNLSRDLEKLREDAIDFAQSVYQ